MSDAMNQIQDEAADLAREEFGALLRLAFIGGSRATGAATDSSDIDTFVVLRAPDADSERRYAHRLRTLHQEAGLTFDHCGEVLDQKTLEDLLTFTLHYLTQVPAIQDLACYQADCLLSVFRKGDVVFKFLADPKIHVDGDRSYLEILEGRATEYFHKFPRPRIQHLKGRLRLPSPGTEQQVNDEFESRLSDERWVDTPVGIGLHRWFGALGAPTSGGPAISSPSSIGGHCPLSRPLDARHIESVRAQCLAHLAVAGD